ncbi:MAG: bacterioferritin [Candidatus Korobacteraceae bacterium]
MRGNEKVIEQLNIALCAELTAIAQYMVQAEICENWGYGRLAGATKGRAIQEMKHAESLIERIIFLDGVPNVAVPLTPEIGANVQQQLEADLASEAGAIKEYNDASAICREAGDAGSKDLFDRLLHDEEIHADFLEAQLHAIQEMGIGPYLAAQFGS